MRPSPRVHGKLLLEASRTRPTPLLSCSSPERDAEGGQQPRGGRSGSRPTTWVAARGCDGSRGVGCLNSWRCSQELNPLGMGGGRDTCWSWREAEVPWDRLGGAGGSAWLPRGKRQYWGVWAALGGACEKTERFLWASVPAALGAWPHATTGLRGPGGLPGRAARATQIHCGFCLTRSFAVPAHPA